MQLVIQKSLSETLIYCNLKSDLILQNLDVKVKSNSLN